MNTDKFTSFTIDLYLKHDGKTVSRSLPETWWLRNGKKVCEEEAWKREGKKSEKKIKFLAT